MKNIQKHYVVIPLITVAVALIGSWFTSKGVNGWYESLNQPNISPPNSVFGPVWTTIYILATISVIMVWDRTHEQHGWFSRWWNRKEIQLTQWKMHAIFILFLANAIFNMMWSYLFFVEHLLLAAFVEMIMLNVTTIILMVFIWPLSRVASLLLVPYVLWVSFATVLMYHILQLN